MKKELRQLIRGTAPIATLVGTNVEWGGSAQGRPLPAIILRKVGGAPGMAFAGPDRQHGALVWCECWAATYDAADSLARAVKTALNGYTSADFQLISLEGERDVNDDREPARAFGISLDLRVWDR